MKMIVLCFVFSISIGLLAQTTKKPVNPEASEETIELLEYLHSVSGEKTLTGQHNPPIRGSNRLSVVHRLTGQYPAVVGFDFGFSYPGYWDGINYRNK